MSLPTGVMTPVPIISPYLPPLDEDYDPLVSAVTGGTNIGDGAAGRDVQRWTAFYDSGVINVADEAGTIQFTRATVGVTTLSLAFDGNMAVTLGYQTAAGSNLYWFDPTVPGYTVLTVSGTDSCIAATDDARQFNVGASDVLLFYTRDKHLYYRQLRDRYGSEYLVGPAQFKLLRAGINVKYRFQVELGNP